jgi:hypothetical protein
MTSTMLATNESRDFLGRIASPEGGLAALRSSARLRRLVCLWVTAAVMLVVSIGETAAQPKEILFLHSFGRHFEPWVTCA